MASGTKAMARGANPGGAGIPGRTVGVGVGSGVHGMGHPKPQPKPHEFDSSSIGSDK